jgi:hypothetical protein
VELKGFPGSKPTLVFCHLYGAIASINIFETKGGVEESNKVGPAWAAKALADLVGGPPEILTGKVIAGREK